MDFTRTATVVTVKYLGENRVVASDANMFDTLSGWMEAEHLTSSAVFVDGEEITNTEDLPETFEGHTVEVRRYEKGGK